MVSVEESEDVGLLYDALQKCDKVIRMKVETKSFQLPRSCLGYKAKRLRLLASGVSKALFACCVWAYYNSSRLSLVIQIDDW